MHRLAVKDNITIAVVSGSRADYGLLYSVMKAIDTEPRFNLQTIVTGMHLCGEFGDTGGIIARDGFTINAEVDCLLSGDTAVATAKSTGLGVIGFADALHKLHPDLLLVLGDRFEIFAAVQAALFLKIPVAHIAGGDTSEGAFDEALRHSISKMSHLHFTTNEQASSRVRQLGENPAHVFTVGSPGIDLINATEPMTRDALQEELIVRFADKVFLITFHPATLEGGDLRRQCAELFAALDHYGNCTLLFTRANADSGGRQINRMIEDYVSHRDNAVLVRSMGQKTYYSSLAHADVVIGNSSSGLYEAPTFKTPTVNLGQRQQGRLRAASVLDCDLEKNRIIQTINQALRMDCTTVTNPYGDGNAGEKILTVLLEYADKEKLEDLLKKHFFTPGPEQP